MILATSDASRRDTTRERAVDLDLLLDGRLSGAESSPLVHRLGRIHRKVRTALGGAR